MAKVAPKPVAKGKPVPEKTKGPTPNLPAVKKAAPSGIIAYEEFEGDRSGFENVTARDVSVPRITILQKLSPQLDKKKPNYVEDAQLGDFCDVSTGEIFREQLRIIPVFYAMIHLEWAPRSTGKGIVNNYGTDRSILDKCTQDEKRKMVLPNGNYVAETATYFVLNLDANYRRSFIPLSSTGLRASRNWMNALTGERVPKPDGSTFQPPMFYRSWIAKPVEVSNNDGDWYTWKFDPSDTIIELDPSKELLAEARSFYEAASSGLIKGDLSGLEQAGEDRSDGDGRM